MFHPIVDFFFLCSFVRMKRARRAAISSLWRSRGWVDAATILFSTYQQLFFLLLPRRGGTHLTLSLWLFILVLPFIFLLRFRALRTVFFSRLSFFYVYLNGLNICLLELLLLFFCLCFERRRQTNILRFKIAFLMRRIILWFFFLVCTTGACVRQLNGPEAVDDL